MNRRAFLRTTALAVGNLTLASAVVSCTAAPPTAEAPTSDATQPPAPSFTPSSVPTALIAATPLVPFVLEEATIDDAQAAMKSGQVTARQLVQQYLDRIIALDRAGPQLHAII